MKSLYMVISNASLTDLILSLSVITVFFLIYQFYQYFASPGPWGFPIVGYYPFLKKNYHIQLAKLVAKYGDLYLFSMGGQLLLHVGSYEASREIYLKNSDHFSGRSQESVLLYDLFGDAVPFSHGETWKAWRKFVAKSMRELGFNSKGLKEDLSNSAQMILKSLRETEDEAFNLSEILRDQCTELIQRLMFGEQVSKEIIVKFNNLYAEVNLLISLPQMLLSGFFARYLILPFTSGYKHFLETKKKIDDTVVDILSEHRLTFDPEHPRDFIDLYLKEKIILEQNKNKDAIHFKDKLLIGNVIQIYGDGGDSIGNFIACCLKDLALKPDIQEAVYTEIVLNIGTEKIPDYSDRDKLPYTWAVIREIERMSTFFPIVPTLTSNCNLTIGNVFIPKGTITLLNHYAVHNDPIAYEHPELFNPLRFVASNHSKATLEPLPISFGMGKRACTGESLIRMELFVILVSIVQHFILSVESEETEEKGIDFHTILDTKFRAILRENANPQLPSK